MVKQDRKAGRTLRLRRQLLEWYARSRRDLPWRRNPDPYSIWVSEIMLQQTRAAVVVERYQAFLERFPTLVSLALAPEEEVLALWSGLGYYRRARMLHKAAQFVANQHQGNLPSSSEELRMLPGIGAYTAAAIASIAYGEVVAVVDGNVERVLCRLEGWEAGSRKGGGAALKRKIDGLATRAGRPRAARRLQPGAHGTGSDGLPAPQSAVPGVPGGQGLRHPRGAQGAATAPHAEPRGGLRALCAHRPSARPRTTARCCWSSGRLHFP